MKNRLQTKNVQVNMYTVVVYICEFVAVIIPSKWIYAEEFQLVVSCCYELLVPTIL